MIKGLFESKIDLHLPDSEIIYFPSFIESDRAWGYFHLLKDSIPWQQDQITVFGKTHPQPRLTALFATNGKPYSYSNITMYAKPFTKELLQLKSDIENISETGFTTCLLNLYRDGRDSNGWHSDDEKALGKNPIIASLSLGEARYFHFRHKKNKALKHKLLLEHGSLLLMKGSTQHHWHHQIPKTSKNIGERINLTFRTIQ